MHETKEKNNMVEILQNGVGRLSRARTPEHIDTLYTEDLQSCIAIMIASDKGVSLIHALIVFDVEDFKKELDWHGKKFKCCFAFNPLFYSYSDVTIGIKELWTAIEKYIKIIYPKKTERDFSDYMLGKNEDFNIYKADYGSVGIKKNGAVLTELKYSKSSFVEFPDIEKRKRIMEINSWFPVGEVVPADLQFDGERYTECPQPLSSPKRIAERICEKKEYKFFNNAIYKVLKLYLEISYNESDKKIISDLMKKILLEITASLQKRFSINIHEKHGFFSASAYATKEQPYGPYLDHFCFPGDVREIDELNNVRKM